MSDDTKGVRTELPAPRTYSIPGGPFQSSLAETQVAILAPIKRGSEDDRGVESKR